MTKIINALNKEKDIIRRGRLRMIALKRYGVALSNNGLFYRTEI